MKGMHGIIFAYDKKTNLRELTDHRVHGAVPFGGDYRLVDFALSNLVNADVSDVGIVLQGKCQSLLAHIGTGKRWDLSRNHGGLTLLPIFGEGQPFRGKMEALGAVGDYLRSIRQDYVALCDCDLAANLPLAEVLEYHIATGADLTAVCTPQIGECADTYFQLNESGRIIDTVCNTQMPSGYRCLNVFVVTKSALLRMVNDCTAHQRYSFRYHVLQNMTQQYRFQGWVWEDYAARICSVQNYYQHTMALLDPTTRRQLFHPCRPIIGKENDAATTYLDPTVTCANCLIADGCDVQGNVRNCVLFRGVRIEQGADVEGCILLENTVVGKGAIVRNVITDKNVVIGAKHTLVGSPNCPLLIPQGGKV